NTSVVSNHGVIETDKSGSVFLLSPIVENSGTISTFFGQAGLIAGKHVEFESGTGQQDISVKECGDNDYAVNTEQGRIYGDYGVAGMYGRVVQQDGLITSVSAVKQSGRIELRARDKIVTGNKSMSLCPVTTSNEKEHSSFPFEGGEITLSGLSDIGDGKLERIEHQGVICAPSGKVRLEGSQRVYLESGSEIDVSGLWIERALEYDVIKAQLNTAQLADEYGQKYGLLHGEWIEFHQRYGSSIGDLSGHLANEKFTAGERSTEGGEIYINVSDGDIICRQGSSIDFSGGGIHHQSGLTDTTQLISGNRLYDISEAPAWIKYDKFAGYFENIHERYGLVDEYKGVFYGSGAPIKNYISEYTEGSNAGSLELIARNVVLDGQINASVERGIFQTLFQEPEDENGNQSAAGYVEPKGGTLSIGTAPTCENGYVANDSRIEEIVVREEVDSLPETFGPEDEIPDSYFKEAENESCLKKLEYQSGQPVYKTMLSAKKLSDAGLSALNLNALTRVTIDNDALLSLRPSGLLLENESNLTVTARNIHHRGTVDIPGGKAVFFSASNITSGIGNYGAANPDDYVSLKDRIYIADGSKILVNGKQIDNSYVNQGRGILSKSSHLDGGRVQIENYSIRIRPDGKPTSEVVVEKGSLIDVSGGYEIDEQGNVSGGDAGVLDIQGATLVLGGELKGHSLVGQQGGSVNIHSGLVNVKNSLAGFEDSMDSVDFEDEIPDDLHNTCYLEKDYFGETGFTNIGLTSVRELIVDNGVHFSPSMMKMPDPFPNSAQQEMSFKNFTGFGTHIKNGLVQVSPDYITSSSVLLAAGKNMKFTGTKDAIPTVFFASQETFFLPESALISVPSEGSISIDAPGIELSGQLQALSGDVQLSASINDIMLNPGSKILAGGYNRPQTSVPANNLRTNFTPVDGGSVYLKSKLGSIDVEQGALIDVSGSTPVVNQYKGADRTIYTGTVAGDSGSVSFSYHDDLELSGNLNAGHHMEGLMGGSLTIGRTDTEEALSIAPGEIDSFIDSGFDAFTFSSYSDLVFQPREEDLLIQAGRRLTLDAPEIIAGNNWNIHLKAPWIQLSNTYDKYDLQSLGSGFDPGVLIPDAVESGESILTLQGDFIDVAGSLGLSGFKNVSLEAGKDIRFDEEDYNKFWEGKLLAPGDF
ncbi:MAG: hypothetical protein IMF13_05220, partial [Proteobacteria bacterium]|nr:hypothetical protein [Pseudomonadota bacterium]